MSTSTDPLHSESQPAVYDQADRIVKRPLSEADARELAEIEQTIQDCLARSLRNSVEIGRSLLRLRDRALFAHQYDDFIEYCTKRWEFSRIHVYRLINAALIVDALPQECNPWVTTERQARELFQVPPGDRVKVLKLAGKNASAQTIKAVRETYKEAAPPPESVPDFDVPQPGTQLGDDLAQIEAIHSKFDERDAQIAAYKQEQAAREEARQEKWRNEHRAFLLAQKRVQEIDEIISTAKKSGRWKDHEDPKLQIVTQLRELLERHQ